MILHDRHDGVVSLLNVYFCAIFGFSCAFFVYALVKLPSQNNGYGSNFYNTIYHVYATILGQCSLLDDITSDSIKSILNDISLNVIRLLFAVYFAAIDGCSVEIFNCNDESYTRRRDRLRHILWCEECLRFTSRLVQDSILRMKTLCRVCCNKFVLLKIRNCDERYAITRLKKFINLSISLVLAQSLMKGVKKLIENLKI